MFSSAFILVFGASEKEAAEGIWSYNFYTFRIGGDQLSSFFPVYNKSIIKAGLYTVVYLNILIF